MEKRSNELATRQALDEAGHKISKQAREKKRIEDAIAFGPKPRLTARDKFNRLGSKGQGDSFDPY